MSDPDDIRRGTLRAAWHDPSEVEAESVACRRCSGGSGLLCARCNVEVNLTGIRDAETSRMPDLEPEA